MASTIFSSSIRGFLLAEIEVLGYTITTDWTSSSTALPADDLDNMIKLEFVFDSDDIFNAPRWHIDDVTVTVP